jgi:hypothetical protein
MCWHQQEAFSFPELQFSRGYLHFGEEEDGWYFIQINFNFCMKRKEELKGFLKRLKFLL